MVLSASITHCVDYFYEKKVMENLHVDNLRPDVNPDEILTFHGEITNLEKHRFHKDEYICWVPDIYFFIYIS